MQAAPYLRALCWLAAWLVALGCAYDLRSAHGSPEPLCGVIGMATTPTGSCAAP